MHDVDCERGVSFVEAAIFLPLILIGIFIIISISVTLNARGALSTGMTDALRLAHTRGDTTVIGGEILPAISALRNGATSEIARSLLTSLPPAERESGMRYLNGCFGAVYNRPLDALPPEHLYTLVYLNQALAQSIGPSFRFPCLPPGSNAPSACKQTVEPRTGCAVCYLIDPDDPDASSASAPLSSERIAIRCEYTPAGVFIDPILALFKTLGLGDSVGGYFTLKRDRYFDVEEFGL